MIFLISTFRLILGIKHPWLFKYTFSDEQVYYSVHSIEIDYFPKSLTIIDVLYIVAPLYACILYATNVFFITLSAVTSSYSILAVTKNILLFLTIPCCAVFCIFGKFGIKLRKG